MKIEARPAIIEGLRLLAGQERAQVFLYHDPEDFEKLWTKEAVRADRPILIYWRGFPQISGNVKDDHVAVDAHVTPYHWALWFAKGLETVASIAILHAFRTDNRTLWDSWGERCRSMDTQLPWLRGYSLSDDIATVGGVQMLTKDSGYLHGMMAIRGHLERAPCKVELEASAINSLRDDLAGDARDHHSIANLVGPLVLARYLDVNISSIDVLAGDHQKRALLKLLEQFGWVHEATDQHGNSLGQILEERSGFDPLNSLANINYAMIDDQADQGYAAVLATSLDAKVCRHESGVDETALTGVGSTFHWWQNHPLGPAGGILAKLDNVVDWATPRLIPNVDILVLDLRLWIGKRNRGGTLDPLKEIVDTAKRLLKIAPGASIAASAHADKWFVEALQAADKSEDSVSESERYSYELASITLLPLLISHYDPSLPIIIFSSSRQREVSKRLRHRPNIHLQFVKPGIVGLPTSAKMVQRDLLDALLAARRQHQLRIVWRRIVSLLTNPPEFPNGLRVLPREPGSSYTSRDAYWKADEMTKGGSATQHLLSSLYLKLLQGDTAGLMTGCYELIETGYSSLAQKRYFVEIGMAWLRQQPIRLNSEQQQSYRYVQLAMALREIRSVAVHGQNLHADPLHSEPAIHLALAAMMVALIDFLEQKSDKYALLNCSQPSLLAVQHDAAFPKEAHTDLGPVDLSSLGGRCGSDTLFIVYALLSALHTVKRPVKGAVSTQDFGSRQLADLCSAFAGDKATPDLLGVKSPIPSGEAEDPAELKRELKPGPVRVVGSSDGGLSETYIQIVIPFEFQIDQFDAQAHKPLAANGWEIQRNELEALARLLNRDSRRGLSKENASLLRLKGGSLILEVKIGCNAKVDHTYSVRLNAPTLFLFDARRSKFGKSWRIGMLLVEYEYLDTCLDFDEVLAINNTLRGNLKSCIGALNAENGLQHLTVNHMVPSGSVVVGSPEVSHMQLHLLAQLGVVSASSMEPYVHAVATTEGPEGIRAFYEEVRNECGELGGKENSMQGSPYECFDLYRLLTVQPPTAWSKRNDDFSQHWLKSRTYNRSARSGVCYAFDYNSSCLILGRDEDATSEYLVPARRAYVVQWIHLLYMRAAISAFSKSLTDLTGDRGSAHRFEVLQGELQYFENVYNFPFISDEGRSRDLYPIARDAMDLDSYLNELDKEVRLTNEYYNRRDAQRLSSHSFRVGLVALIFAAVSMIFGFLGMNLLDDESICAMQRSLGDSQTSYCERTLKAKVVATLADEIEETDASRLSRASYSALCAAKIGSLSVNKELKIKFDRVLVAECKTLEIKGLAALETWYGEPKSSRWVSGGAILVGLAMLAILAAILFPRRRR